MAKRVSPFIIRHTSDQLASAVAKGVITANEAMKKLGGLAGRKGK